MLDDLLKCKLFNIQHHSKKKKKIKTKMKTTSNCNPQGELKVGDVVSLFSETRLLTLSCFPISPLLTVWKGISRNFKRRKRFRKNRLRNFLFFSNFFFQKSFQILR